MLLKSLVKAYVHDSADPVVLGQYVEHLEQMLARLMKKQKDTHFVFAGCGAGGDECAVGGGVAS